MFDTLAVARRLADAGIDRGHTDVWGTPSAKPPSMATT